MINNVLLPDENALTQDKKQNDNFKKNIKIIVSIAVFLIFSIFANVFSIYLHERVHQRIYERYGINSTIGMESPIEFYTRPNTTQFLYFCKENPEDCRNMINLHLINEIVGYNISSIELLLSGIFILLYLLLLEVIEMRK